MHKQELQGQDGEFTGAAAAWVVAVLGGALLISAVLLAVVEG